MTVRRLAVIVDQLLNDPNSALLRAVLEEQPWTPGDYIAAAHHDAYVKATYERPKFYPRPGEARREAERVAARHSALEAQLERAKRQQEGADLA